MDQFVESSRNSVQEEPLSFETVAEDMDRFAAGLSRNDDANKNLILFAAELVKLLMLTEINPELGITTSNLELALHEQEVLRNYIWAWGFQMFLKFWLSHIQPVSAEDAKVRRLLEDRNKEALALLRDEKVHPITRLLIRRTLNLVKVSLMELVRTVYPKDGCDKQTRFRRKVKESLELFDDVGAWSFEMKGDGPDYEIEAGKALKEFSRLVYTPLAIHQTKFFGDLVSSHLVSKGGAS